jgi:hypothetical protein
MSEILISFASSTEVRAKRIAGGVKALDYGVWRDHDLAALRDDPQFGAMIIAAETRQEAGA